MRLPALICVLVALSGSHAMGTTWFVNNQDGDNHYTGRHEIPSQNTPAGPFATIQYAVDWAQPGDTIYVKATPTSYAGFVVTKPNIRIIGYLTTYSPTVDLDSGTFFPDSLTTATSASTSYLGYPIVNAAASASNTTGIYVRSASDTTTIDQVEIRNIFVKNFITGVSLERAKQCTLTRIFAAHCGGLNSPTNPTSNSGGTGIGIVGHPDHRTDNTKPAATLNTITNCVVYNGEDCGVQLKFASNNTVTSCKVFGDRYFPGSSQLLDFYGTDYYFEVTDGDENTIIGCEAYRKAGSNHEGHGFTVQKGLSNPNGIAWKNLVSGCKTFNMNDCILLRGNQTHQNRFIGITSYRPDKEGSAADIHGCIQLSGGPHDNGFQNIRLVESKYGFYSYGNPDQGAGQTSYSSYNNTFYNCIFETSNSCITLQQSGTFQTCVDNKFVNCTFVCRDVAGDGNYGRFIETDAMMSLGNSLQNCIVFQYRVYGNGPSWNFNTNSSTPIPMALGWSACDHTVFFNPLAPPAPTSTAPYAAFPSIASYSGIKNYTFNPASLTDDPSTPYFDYIVGASSPLLDVTVFPAQGDCAIIGKLA